MKLSPGHVLWLKLPFGKTDEISKIFHPYIVISVTSSNFQLVEVGQLDSDIVNPWDTLLKMAVPIDNENPKESVIYKPSYLQIDRKIQIEYFDELTIYMDTDETLSSDKLQRVIDGYYARRNKYGSDSFRDMYFSKEDIISYNPMEEWEAAHKQRIRMYHRQ